MGINDDVNERHDRPLKYKWVCHAERNAMDLAPRDLSGCIMFVTFSPCSSCAQSIIQRGIKTVVVDATYIENEMTTRWKDDMDVALEMMEEAGVAVLWAFPAVDE